MIDRGALGTARGLAFLDRHDDAGKQQRLERADLLGPGAQPFDPSLAVSLVIGFFDQNMEMPHTDAAAAQISNLRLKSAGRRTQDGSERKEGNESCHVDSSPQRTRIIARRGNGIGVGGRSVT